MSENLRKILVAIHGEKKVEIFEFISQNADKNGFINYTLGEICSILNTSKPTVINTFKILEKSKILIKIKNGLYQIKI